MGPILLLVLCIPLFLLFGWTPGSAWFAGESVLFGVGWIGLAQFALAELIAVVGAWRWLKVTGVSPGAVLIPGAIAIGMTLFFANAVLWRIELGPDALRVRTLSEGLNSNWAGVKSAAVTIERTGKNHDVIHYWLNVECRDGKTINVELGWLHDSERELLELALSRYRKKP